MSSPFRRLWGATGLTAIGDAINEIALPLIALMVLDATPFQLALLVAVEMMWWPIVGLPAGVWVDRYSRRAILVATYAGRALLVGSVFIASTFAHLTMVHVFVVAAATGLLAVFESVAEIAILPGLVPPDALVSANSRLSAMTSIVDIGGRGLAGLLIFLTSTAGAFLVEAVLAAGAAFTIAGVCEAPRPAQLVRRSFRRELAEGARFTFRKGPFRTLTIVSAAWNLGVAAQFVLLFLLLQDTLGLGPVMIGLLLTSGGVGALLGAAVAERVSARSNPWRAWRLALLAGCPAALLIPTAQLGPLIGVFILGSLVFSASSTLAAIVNGSLKQALCPPELIGRVSATSRVLTWGVVPVGALAAGALTTWFGARLGLVFAALPFAGAAIIAWGTNASQKPSSDLASLRG